MKNKGLIITLIIILTLIAISLIGILTVLLTNNKNFNLNINTKEYELVTKKEYNIENIEEINIDLVSSDIEIKNSDDNKIKIEYYGNKKDNIDIKIENNKIIAIEKPKNNFCIGICLNETKMILYVPNNFDKKMIYKTISGDIEFEEDYTNSNIKINTTSGDINVNNVNELNIFTISGDVRLSSATKLDIRTTSGDIKIDKVNNYLKLKTVSGDINIESININKESYIETTSGDVEINKTNDIYVDTKTTSGDINILNNNRRSDYVLNIKTISGDIEIN